MRTNPSLFGGVLAPALVALGALLFVPQYAAVLAPFGDLPWVSRAVLATYQWWSLVPLAIVGWLAATGLHRSRPERVSRAGVLVAGGLAAVAVLGVYAPIWSLANG